MKKRIIRMLRRFEDEMAVSALAQEGEVEMALEILKEADKENLTKRHTENTHERMHPSIKPVEEGN